MAHTSQIGPPFSQILDFLYQNSWLCFFWYLSGPSKAIFDIFSKIFEKLSIKEFWRSPSTWWKIGKDVIFSIYWRKCWFCWLNLDSIGSQLSFEVYISIVTQIFKFFKFLVYKMSFLIFMIAGFIVVKIYIVGDCFWFQMKDRYQIIYFQTSFDQLVAFL